MLADLKKDLQELSDPQKAKDLSWFFKTGKGEYGEGDVFLGLSVGDQRKIGRKYADLPLRDVQKLLSSRVHEYRLVALLILVDQYQQAVKTNSLKNQKKIIDFYLKNTAYINNWDLVDLSTPKILGAYLLDKDRSVLYKLAKSKNWWERRISILATFAFIREKDFADSLKIAKLLLNDQHDLIHKAVGWMLREVGKRDQAAEEKFLDQHVKNMPRTMLRYAIEKFAENKRQAYLKK